MCVCVFFLVMSIYLSFLKYIYIYIFYIILSFVLNILKNIPRATAKLMRYRDDINASKRPHPKRKVQNI